MKKIKVCYFNGSNRANGRTNKIINLFFENLSKNSKFDYKFINLIEEGTQIKTCIGCLNCFKKGICPLDDSITKIKQTMMNSDIVVFATPVYMGFVSGQMKIFLDRLSLWTHLQKLLTKKCVLIVVTQNTSLDETTKYLYEVVSNFGLEIIGCITLRILMIILNNRLSLSQVELTDNFIIMLILFLIFIEEVYLQIYKLIIVLIIKLNILHMKLTIGNKKII